MEDASMETLKANRVRAYKYMVSQLSRLEWIPPINSDSGLANFFDIPLDDIVSLKTGNSNPAEKIAMQLKQLQCNQGNEEEIDYYLVIPFLDNV